MGKHMAQTDSSPVETSVWSVLETIVVTFFLVYGLSQFGSVLRTRYFTWLGTLGLDEGLNRVGMYCGHIAFFATLLVYALAVKKDRKYIFSFLDGTAGRNLKFALLGAVTGFAMNAGRIYAAYRNGDLAIQFSPNASPLVFLLAVGAVFFQSSTEEIEARGFLFGKMKDEGVPVFLAVIVSAFYFGFMYLSSPGFGLIPLACIMAVGIMFALSYHYFGTIWFAFMAHTMWNYTQDFIFGLPNSGKPAAASLFTTTVSKSSFYYDEVFGIEGSVMAIIVFLAASLVVLVIGLIMRQRAARSV